jgi:pyruvate formate lyase activating enzyme
MATHHSNGACQLCGSRRPRVIEALGVCRDCATRSLSSALPLISEAHAANRRLFGLPEEPPRAEGGAGCPLCARACTMVVGERGYCGMRIAIEGRSRAPRIRHLAGRPSRGLVHWYRDPLPTNCVADWVCAGHAMRGRHNLAVFYSSCTFNCLFCQNWHYRQTDPATADGITADQLADRARPDTFCVCYFGGDPASQMPHALASARRLAARGVTVCWETNGSQNPKLMREAVRLSAETGGTVKFDLKAYDEGLHVALTGASNRRTLENLESAAAVGLRRRQPPLVVASTLLVPGYVTPEEVGHIACFLSAIDPDIPYALLAFAPQFAAADLPITSRRHAEEAADAARDAGLTRVRIGNRHLLGAGETGVWA